MGKVKIFNGSIEISEELSPIIWNLIQEVGLEKVEEKLKECSLKWKESLQQSIWRVEDRLYKGGEGYIAYDVPVMKGLEWSNGEDIVGITYEP